MMNPAVLQSTPLYVPLFYNRPRCVSCVGWGLYRLKVCGTMQRRPTIHGLSTDRYSLRGATKTQRAPATGGEAPPGEQFYARLVAFLSEPQHSAAWEVYNAADRGLRRVCIQGLDR